MGGVLLDMPHGVEQQLGDGGHAPVVPHALGLVFVFELLDPGPTLGARVGQVALQLRRRVDPLR